MDTFSITARAKTYPKLPYEDMKNAILGKRYALSLVFTGAQVAKRLNTEHRGKTYVPNVLSFPLSSDAGEIFITPTVAKKEARKFNMSVNGYIGFLFIHGLLHLKGLDHGDTMEKAEKKYCMRYNLR